MFRRCIFCSAELGSNNCLEEFPVGRSLAVEAWTGRLWAICPDCGRWNLAPIEERWEAVESAERLFRDCASRVQSEQIGLAALADGTRLVRVGRPLPGELAAWRYGEELVRRRRRALLRTTARFVFADVGLLMFLAERAERRQAVVQRCPSGDAWGHELWVRTRHLHGARVLGGADGQVMRMDVPASDAVSPSTPWWVDGRGPPVTLNGAAARGTLARVLVHVNVSGAPRPRTREAVAALERAGAADEYLARLVSRGALGFVRRFGRLRLVRQDGAAPSAPLAKVETLALEMALHDRAERQALGGDLQALEDAWREADEIARIADALPDDVLPGDVQR
jgi:hypothetical protein